jgi:hypothetical protein
VDELEGAGLAYYEDFFELSGSWPEWLEVVVRGVGRNPTSAAS